MKKNKKNNGKPQDPHCRPCEEMTSKTDPLGSYTGNPTEDTTPVQDADDL